MKFTGLWKAGQAPQLWIQPYKQAMPWTAVYTWEFAQQGNLCSLHCKIRYSMFSNTTTRAKEQEPTVPGSRTLINTPLFCLETSLSFLLLSCEIGWRQEEKQGMMLAVFCTPHCCTQWIKYRGSKLSPSGSCSIRVLCKEDVQVRLDVKDPHKRHSHPQEKWQSRSETPPHSTAVIWLSPWLQCSCLSVHEHFLWAYLGISWHLRGVNLLKLKWQ